MQHVFHILNMNQGFKNREFLNVQFTHLFVF